MSKHTGEGFSVRAETNGDAYEEPAISQYTICEYLSQMYWEICTAKYLLEFASNFFQADSCPVNVI